MSEDITTTTIPDGPASSNSGATDLTEEEEVEAEQCTLIGGGLSILSALH